jgi:hypothetical protein
LAASEDLVLLLSQKSPQAHIILEEENEESLEEKVMKEVRAYLMMKLNWEKEFEEIGHYLTKDEKNKVRKCPGDPFLS